MIYHILGNSLYNINKIFVFIQSSFRNCTVKLALVHGKHEKYSCIFIYLLKRSIVFAPMIFKKILDLMKTVLF